MRDPTAPPLSKQAGLTLSELMVALAVTSIIVVLVYQVFISQQRIYTAQEDVAEAQQNARVAIDELTRTVSPLGSGVAAAEGQVRILMAHPYQLLFNADLSDAHSALAPGTDLTGVAGYTADDPYATLPGIYAASAAETYRYHLRADAGGVHHSLYREVNLHAPGNEVARHLGNLREAIPLFRYYGDFDGDGSYETLERVDRATSPLVAAGASLDAVIRRVDVHIVAETPFPDPLVASHGGYRQTVLKTSIAPRNVWDCPTIQTASPDLSGLRAPTLRGTTTGHRFRVLRGALAEQGRTVLFSVAGPPGYPGFSGQTTTDADGYATATIPWPNPGPPCDTLPAGTYVVTATTSTPPSLDTAFGTCAQDSARIQLGVIDGLITTTRFSSDLLQLASCGEHTSVEYELLDACGRTVDPADVGADQVWFTDPQLGGALIPDRVPAGQSSGIVEYRSDTNPHVPTALRSVIPPHPFMTTLEARLGGASGPSIGTSEVQIYPLPEVFSGLTANLSGTGALFSDCPNSAGLNSETFQLADRCGNPVWTLNGSYLGSTYSIEARLESVYPGNVGGLTSTHNAPLPANPVMIRENSGIDGEFDVSYTPPTCGLGQFPRAVELVLVPSWDPTQPAGPVAFQVQPCTSCAVQVVDPTGSPTTQLDRECAPAYDVVVTHCEDPGPATVELVLVPLAGTTPSFAPTTFQDRVLLSFDRTNPPGSAQQAVARLHMGWATTGSRFRILAYLPDEASYASGLLPSAVACESDPVDVDTSCEEILISDTPDNRGAYPSNSRPEDVPICALEGSEVYFRVKDCDQNRSDTFSDDLHNLAGSSRGIRVEAVDQVTRAVLDLEEVDDLFEVDENGLGRSDQPYFQGSLQITQDPRDPPGSGRLRVPEGRVVELRATYRDPDDPSDNLCEAFALLVPPVPVCLPFPAASFGDWVGDLTVRGGDAVVAGDLQLRAGPNLLDKDETDPIDRFFNAYVGGLIRVGGTPAGSTGPVGQPLYPQYPNYFQLVPDTASLLTRLDYTTLKTLAKARRVYWEPDPVTGILTNPLRSVAGTGQPLQGSLKEVLNLPGPGIATSHHPQQFLFVDAPAGLQSATAIDAAPLSALPQYTVSGDFYTEGLVYVAGSVSIGPVGAGQSVPIEFAADRDARYDESNGGFTRGDLPFDFDGSTGRVAVGSRAVHWNGALYTEGEIELVGRAVVHGVVSAERGVRNTDSAEIWYDPSWMESRLELCAECCGLNVTPASPTALLGSPLQLSANRPQGQVVWETLTPQIAMVDNSGLVEPLQEGTAVIRASDAAGCIAELEVAVTCGLFLTSSAGTSLIPGEVTNIFASAAQGSLTWSSDNPSVLELDRTTGVSVVATAKNIGGSQVAVTETVTTASGTAQCEAALDFVVNCPVGQALVASTLAPQLGDTLTLDVVDAAGTPVSSGYTFFADGAALADPRHTPTDLTPVVYTAELTGTACSVGPLTVFPECPTFSVVPSASTANVGDSVTLAVLDAAGNDVTAEFSFAVASGPGTLVAPATVRLDGAGEVQVDAVDEATCVAAPVTLVAL